jgi:hypothetical protein
MGEAPLLAAKVNLSLPALQKKKSVKSRILIGSQVEAQN